MKTVNLFRFAMVSNTTEELRARYDYGRDNIVSPCAQQLISDTDKKRLSARKLKVKAGVGVRICKIKAYRDDTLYDVIYIATQPCDDKENYLDEEYYAHARQDRKSTRLNSSHIEESRMPSSA